MNGVFGVVVVALLARLLWLWHRSVGGRLVDLSRQLRPTAAALAWVLLLVIGLYAGHLGSYLDGPSTYFDLRVAHLIWTTGYLVVLFILYCLVAAVTVTCDRWSAAEVESRITELARLAAANSAILQTRTHQLEARLAVLERRRVWRWWPWRQAHNRCSTSARTRRAQTIGSLGAQCRSGDPSKPVAPQYFSAIFAIRSIFGVCTYSVRAYDPACTSTAVDHELHLWRRFRPRRWWWPPSNGARDRIKV